MSTRKASFRQFAECESIQDFEAFASVYGRLGVEEMSASEAVIRALWRKEQRLLRDALERWDALRGRDPKAESVLVEIDPANFADQTKPDLALARRYLKRERGEPLLKRTLLLDRHTADEAPRKELARTVNVQLARLVSLRVSSDLRALKPVSVSGMLGVMWLQLAETISGQRPEKECARPQCRAWFVPKRSDAIYCSPDCKVKAFRAKPSDVTDSKR